MTKEVIVIGSLGISAAVAAYVTHRAIQRRKEKIAKLPSNIDPPFPVVGPQYVVPHHTKQSRYRHPVTTSPSVVKPTSTSILSVDDSSDLLNTVVTTVATESILDSHPDISSTPSPTFEGFGGASSDWGGASSDWGAPDNTPAPCDTSSDFSSSDSTPCDVPSSDTPSSDSTP